MTADMTVVSDQVADSDDIMASVDGSGATARLVIADISRDDTWLSVPASCSLDLQTWR